MIKIITNEEYKDIDKKEIPILLIFDKFRTNCSMMAHINHDMALRMMFDKFRENSLKSHEKIHITTHSNKTNSYLILMTKCLFDIGRDMEMTYKQLGEDLSEINKVVGPLKIKQLIIDHSAYSGIQLSDMCLFLKRYINNCDIIIKLRKDDENKYKRIVLNKSIVEEEISRISEESCCKNSAKNSAMLINNDDVNKIKVIETGSNEPVEYAVCSKYDTCPFECENMTPLQRELHCTNSIHAIRKVIDDGKRDYVAFKNKAMITMYRPCVECAEEIGKSGIKFLYYLSGDIEPEVVHVLEKHGIFHKKL